ncbi:hypothetical protein DRQ33_07160, partial [bacterium]
MKQWWFYILILFGLSQLSWSYCSSSECTSYSTGLYDSYYSSYSSEPAPWRRSHSSSISSDGNYKYYMPNTSGQTYYFTTCEDYSPAGASYDTYICIYNPSCGLITSNDDNCSASSLHSYCSWSYSGNSYPQVAGFSSSSGSYTVAYWTTATDLTATTSWQTTSGSIDVAYSSRWYRINCTAGYMYIFSLCSDDGGSAGFDTALRLYNSSGTSVAVNDDFCGLQSRISWSCGSSGTYYLQVRGYSSGTGSFTLAYKYASVCANTNQGTLYPTTSWQNAAYSSGTMPYWSFSATVDYVYDFSMCSNSEDSYIRIYDSGWNLVDYQDDNGPFCSGTPASISWTCTSSGTYYVAVSHYSCSNLYNNGNLAYKYQPACAPPTSVTATANGSSSGTTICSGSAVTLSGSHSGGNCSSWNWQYRWRTSSGTIRDWSTTLNYTIWPTSSNTYYLDVRCSGCPGSLTTDDVLVTVNYSASGTPSLSSPANGSSTTDRTPTFTWTCSGCSFGSPNGRYEIEINGVWYNAGTTANFTPWWNLTPGPNTWRVRIRSDCGTGGTSGTWTVYITPDDYCGNVDHGGNNWIISSSRTVSGYHFNVGTFRVNSGVTATVNSSCHYLVVDAQDVDVQGTINGDGAGESGGSGGSGGSAYGSCSNEGDNYYSGGHGSAGGAGFGSGGGSAGSNGGDGYGRSRKCGGLFCAGNSDGHFGGGGGAGGG